MKPEDDTIQGTFDWLWMLPERVFFCGFYALDERVMPPTCFDAFIRHRATESGVESATAVTR